MAADEDTRTGPPSPEEKVASAREGELHGDRAGHNAQGTRAPDRPRHVPSGRRQPPGWAAISAFATATGAIAGAISVLGALYRFFPLRGACASNRIAGARYHAVQGRCPCRDRHRSGIEVLVKNLSGSPPTTRWSGFRWATTSNTSALACRSVLGQLPGSFAPAARVQYPPAGSCGARAATVERFQLALSECAGTVAIRLVAPGERFYAGAVLIPSRNRQRGARALR